MAGCEGADEGACVGCWRLSPPEGCADWAGGCADCAAELLVPLWPWNDRAAASETAPDRTTAPAMIQRLTREINAIPASRVVTALGLTLAMIGANRKKTLNRG